MHSAPHIFSSDDKNVYAWIQRRLSWYYIIEPLFPGANPAYICLPWPWAGLTSAMQMPWRFLNVCPTCGLWAMLCTVRIRTLLFPMILCSQGKLSDTLWSSIFLLKTCVLRCLGCLWSHHTLSHLRVASFWPLWFFPMWPHQPPKLYVLAFMIWWAAMSLFHSSVIFVQSSCTMVVCIDDWKVLAL